MENSVIDICRKYINNSLDIPTLDALRTEIHDYLTLKNVRDHTSLRYDIRLDSQVSGKISIQPGNLFTFIMLMDLEEAPPAFTIEGSEMWQGKHQYFRENGNYYLNRNKTIK